MTKQYNFKDVKSGTTFQGVQFQLKINKAVKDLTGASIVMTVGASIFSTANGAILISDAANGKFQFKKQLISLKPDNYSYKITTTFADGDIKTYIEGHWRIL